MLTGSSIEFVTGSTVISTSSTVRASEQQVSSNVAGETVILSVDDGMYYGLDAVGTRIWTLLQEPRAVEEIHRRLIDEYDVPSEQCMRDLLDLLEELRERQLIIVQEEPS